MSRVAGADYSWGSGREVENALAQELGTSRPTVRDWRARFAAGGVKALYEDRPRGKGAPVPRAKEAEVIAKTQKPPENATQWSCRGMAKASGVSTASVQRIWQANGLKPHLIRTFKLSNDPHFLEKLDDVVGLYMNPPEHAWVFCIDEKSQIQALDRTQPGLPMKKGRCGTMTHDYKHAMFDFQAIKLSNCRSDRPTCRFMKIPQVCAKIFRTIRLVKCQTSRARIFSK